FDLEGIMALRRIGQEVLRFGAKALRPTSLDQLLALIDVAPAERALARLYPSAMGEKAWPPIIPGGKQQRLEHRQPTSRSPRRFLTARAFGAFAALPATKKPPSARRLCAFGACL